LQEQHYETRVVSLNCPNLKFSSVANYRAISIMAVQLIIEFLAHIEITCRERPGKKKVSCDQLAILLDRNFSYIWAV